jgi:hypothetical protein
VASRLLRLTAAWHARVRTDEVVSHAFSRGFHPEHTEWLAAYWAEGLGGPATFSTECGRSGGSVTPWARFSYVATSRRVGEVGAAIALCRAGPKG